jgi:hypothetical protein
MNDSNMVVVTRADGVEVIHYYATESDARYQYAVWRGEGVDCKLALPIPAQVLIAWETDVTERYRTTVNTADLPQSVQDALADGLSIIDIDRALDAKYDVAKDELFGFICDHEEGPYDENVTDRNLDYTAIEEEPKR